MTISVCDSPGSMASVKTSSYRSGATGRRMRMRLKRMVIAGLLGAALYRAGQYDAAVDRLRTSIRLATGRTSDSNTVVEHYFLSMALQRVGDFEEASQALAKARSLQDVLETAQRGQCTWREHVWMNLLKQEAQQVASGAAAAR